MWAEIHGIRKSCFSLCGIGILGDSGRGRADAIRILWKEKAAGAATHGDSFIPKVRRTFGRSHMRLLGQWAPRWLMELKSKPLEIGSSSGELPWEACLHAVLAGSWGLLQPPPMPWMRTGMGASSSSYARSCEVAWVGRKKGSCQHVSR